ncbi:MAG: 4-hydroxy-tetrahydrodipicolinate reductase [Bacteroidetes bacterium]|nr:4-hydroxy-tetrahydrodipicolinate reductase [Bacteroidota bacterium]
MRIALIGYGKMGQAIEKIALERGHKISCKVNSDNPIEQVDFSQTDVAIEFTKPELATKHIIHCIDASVPIVVGTTAWQEELEAIKAICLDKSGSLLYASNFSLGVNIFFEINKRLAQLLSDHPEYQAEVEEIHHLQKLDAPSGTAIDIAKGIVSFNQNYSGWKTGLNEKPEVKNDELPIIAKREPDVPGTHTVNYISEIDTISLTHQAHNRKGFALGAVIAAEWVVNKKGVFTMSNILNS